MSDDITNDAGGQTPVIAYLWLHDRPQWVAWRYMERAGRRTKPPVNPHTGRDADVTDPATWGTWGQARERQLNDDLPGMGFVLTVDDGLAGVDLDDCLDGEGRAAPWAAAIVDALDSYTEVSPSGTGLHILAWGRLPPGRRRAGNIEMYEAARYLTFTGAVYAGRWALCERSEALAAVHARYLGEPATTQRAPAAAPVATAGPALDDLAIVEKLFRSRAGQRIAALWTGNTAGYASPSEADLALAVHLAFYTDDPAQIRRLVAMSGLGARDKWQRDDYARATIQQALASRAATYDPTWRSRP